MLKKLQEYFESTDQATRKSDWEEVEKMEFDGPNAFDYIEYMDLYYSVCRGNCRQETITIPENMTPNYSGSSFFCNIAL